MAKRKGPPAAYKKLVAKYQAEGKDYRTAQKLASKALKAKKAGSEESAAPAKKAGKRRKGKKAAAPRGRSEVGLRNQDVLPIVSKDSSEVRKGKLLVGTQRAEKLEELAISAPTKQEREAFMRLLRKKTPIIAMKRQPIPLTDAQKAAQKSKRRYEQSLRARGVSKAARKALAGYIMQKGTFKDEAEAERRRRAYNPDLNV